MKKYPKDFEVDVTRVGYQDAEDWYNRTQKAEIIAYVERCGFDLTEQDGTLVENWADVSMDVYMND